MFADILKSIRDSSLASALLHRFGVDPLLQIMHTQEQSVHIASEPRLEDQKRITFSLCLFQLFHQNIVMLPKLLERCPVRVREFACAPELLGSCLQTTGELVQTPSHANDIQLFHDIAPLSVTDTDCRSGEATARTTRRMRFPRNGRASEIDLRDRAL
jgi:hypothetical protein